MKRRLVVLTEIIAPYRIPVFNALATRTEIDLHVIFLAKTDNSRRNWQVYEDEIRFSYEVLPSWRRRIGKYHVLLNTGVVSHLRKTDPEVLVCGGYNYPAAWQAMRWAKQNRVPFLLWSESTASDFRGQHFPVEWLKKKFLRSCTGFVVPGHSAREYLQNFASPAQEIFLARNAVDIVRFATKANMPEPTGHLREQLALPSKYFLFVGRLVRSKGVVDLIAAYSQLSVELRSQISLVIAGDGPLRGEIEALASDIHPGAVLFAGFVQRDELAKYYGLAECLVMPTHTDPWGLVVNEAMACGLPVICANVAGCAADLVHENGLLVPPGDVRRLAEAMTTIATNSDLRRSMSRASLKLIQNYSPEACANGFAEAVLSSELREHV